MKILIVDDDLKALEPFIDAMKSDLHSVTHIRSVGEALRTFNDAHGTGSWSFDLLVLDVQIRAQPGERISEDLALESGITILYNTFRRYFRSERVMILTNHAARVPDLSDDLNLTVRDKVVMADNPELFLRLLKDTGSGD